MKKIETVQDFVDRFYQLAHHHGGPCSGQCAPGSTGKMCELIRAEYPQLKTFLDVGAGTGGWAIVLREMGKEVTELDHNPRDESVVRGDMHNMPFEDGKFDAVFASHVFEHSISPMMFLAEANRVLRLGGISFLAFPFPIKPWVNEWDHSSVLTFDQTINLIEKTGFELKKYRALSENNEEFERIDQYPDPTRVMQIFVIQKMKEI